MLVEVAAGGAETASAAKRRNHKSGTMFTNVKSIPPFEVTAMNHFIHIFNNSITDFNVRIKKFMKMI